MAQDLGIPAPRNQAVSDILDLAASQMSHALVARCVLCSTWLLHAEGISTRHFCKTGLSNTAVRAELLGKGSPSRAE